MGGPVAVVCEREERFAVTVEIGLRPRRRAARSGLGWRQCSRGHEAVWRRAVGAEVARSTRHARSQVRCVAV